MPVSTNLTAPQGVLPGHLGVILEARVLLSDIAATMVDLAHRQVIDVEQEPDGGWLISVPADDQTRALTGYETTLIHALPAAPTVLDRIEGSVPLDTRKALIHDGVSRGWLRHLNHNLGTPASEELAGQIRVFRRQMGRLRREQGLDALTGALLPYAVRLGLITEEETPLARFSQAWVDRFAGLPGWRTRRSNERTTGPDRDLQNAIDMANGWQTP